ncbi:MAG: peptide deformylase [Hyphomicrobiales bacterium]
MSILDIITIPDKILKQACDPVERVDDELRTLLDNMLETMYDAPGIGLAAPQIGVLRRAITIDVSRRAEDDESDAPIPKNPLFMINPEIVWSSDEPSVYDEGCLSIPEYYAEVERPAEVIVSYLDRDGRQNELKADGILATCVQHEIDHLDGILFIDYLSKLKRDRVIKKFAKIKKAQVL